MQIASTVKGTIHRHPFRWTIAGAFVIAVAGFLLYWFAPWNLFVDRRVDEALPMIGSTSGHPADEVPGLAPGDAAEDHGGEEADGGDGTGPVTLASGAFSGLEHATAGSALVVELEDGSRFLRLQDLETSNGPDLRVILTDQPPSDDWHVWDDGMVLDLGALKGNLGSSNYEIPANVDLSLFETAVIWCRRFSVGFGVAPFDPP
jgi:hypothetical protein